MPAFVSKNIQARSVGRYYLIVQNEIAPTDAEWDEMLVHAKATGTMLPSLVFTYGGAPNVAQRARLNQAFGGHKPRASVMTPSAVARTIGIAVTWFNPSVKMFAPTELEAALDHLGVAAGDRPAIRAALEEMKAALGPVKKAMQG